MGAIDFIEEVTLEEAMTPSEIAHIQKLRRLRISETYRDRVTGIREVKCWTIFDLENLERLQLRRTRTNRNLVAQLEGEEIEIVVSKWPPLRERNLLSATYQGQQVYPFKPPG